MSHQEFKGKFEKAARRVLMHDGIYDFQKSEVNSLFSSNKTFRELALKETGGDLFKTKDLLFKNDKTISKLINQTMKQVQEVKETKLKKDTPIVQYSHKINRAMYHRKKIMEEAESILGDMIERGGPKNLTEKQKTEKREFLKTMIRQDPSMKSIQKKASVEARYHANELHRVEDVKRVISRLLLTDCHMSKEYLKPIRENNFPRVKTLKSPTHDKKTRKARR